MAGLSTHVVCTWMINVSNLSSSCVEPKLEVLYELDDADAGEGHMLSPGADSLQEKAKKAGLLSMGLGLKVSIMGMQGWRGKMGHG